MTMPFIRALRGSLLGGLLAFSAVAALAAAAYTPEERKLVDKLPDLFQSKCIEGATLENARETPERRAATAPLMDAMRGPNGTCACVSKEIMRHITPELIHRPDVSAQMNTFAVDAGTVCIARMMRTAFPPMCPEVMRKALSGRGLEVDMATYVPGLCQCVQKRMDALSPAELKPYLNAVVAGSGDANSRDAAIQHLPPAFERDIRECGVATANKIIDAQTSASKAATAEIAASEATPASAP